MDNAKEEDPYPNRPVELVPVLQLRKEDVPELEFFPDTDLLQLMWCPLDHDGLPAVVAKPFVFWRRAEDVSKPRSKTPDSPLASEWYRIQECKFHFERVEELPPIQELSHDVRTTLAQWNIEDFLDDYIDEAATFYEWECSTCPGNKVGGYPHFVQDRTIPQCDCGKAMDHLVTITDNEFDAGTRQRWCPIEDASNWSERNIFKALGFIGFGAGYQHIFICRTCRKWPIKAVFVR